MCETFHFPSRCGQHPPPSSADGPRAPRPAGSGKGTKPPEITTFSLDDEVLHAASASNQKAKDDMVPSPETDRLVAARPPEALSKDEAQREAAEAATEAGPMAAESDAKVKAEREAAEATAAALHVNFLFIVFQCIPY